MRLLHPMAVDRYTWPDRLYGLDVSRGLAAISVILWHWQFFAYKGTALSQDFVRENQPLYDVFRIFYEKGYTGVEYFFMLSGFVFFWLYKQSIQDKKTGILVFGVQRFSRLYPLHFVTLIVVALLQFLYISREGTPFVYPCNDAYHFLLNVFFASNWGFEKGLSFNAPVWSVSIEILLYMIFFLIAFLRQGGLVTCLLISLVSYFISAFSFHLFYLPVFSLNLLFSGLSSFFMGGGIFYITRMINGKYHKLKIPVFVISIVLWVCVIAAFHLFDKDGIFHFLGKAENAIWHGFRTYALFPFTICGVTLLEIEKGDLFKPIAWVGDITYATYLLHFPLQLLFVVAIHHSLLGPSFYRNPICLLLFFVLLIPFSWLVYHRFERPAQNAIRRRFVPG